MEPKSSGNRMKRFKSYILENTRFDLPDYYQPLQALGHGAYGVVCSAMDHRSNQHVAIKKMVNPFALPQVAKYMCREIKLLRFFNHNNIIGIKDLLNPLSKNFMQDLYMVSEYMDSDLHKMLKEPHQELTDKHIQYFMFQILCGLKYIHSANVIHRDLKPANILVNEDCDIKICDFGMSRTPEQIMTMYVATRWYRAPELVLSAGQYSTAVDLWSCGCILAELYNREPLFKCTHKQNPLVSICKVMGSPTETDLEEMGAKGLPLGVPKNVSGVSIEALVPRAPKVAKDLILKMLTFNPKYRITIDEALKHEYFEGFADCLDGMPLCKEKFVFPFDDKKNYTIEEIKHEIYKDIAAFYPDVSPEFSPYDKLFAEKQFEKKSLSGFMGKMPSPSLFTFVPPG